MIKIGIDSVEIERFIPWTTFSQERLLRIFSPEEISYSLSVPRKAAERLAVRFAAKEAFYKAAIPLLPQPVPFLTLARHSTITFGTRGEPQLNFSWERVKMMVWIYSRSITHPYKCNRNCHSSHKKLLTPYVR